MSSGGRYEKWIGGVFQHQVPPRRPALTTRRAVLAAVSVSTWVLVLVTEPIVPALRIPVAVALIVTFFAGLVIWTNIWSNVIERAHARLLVRLDLGDLPRVIAFATALVGYGVGSMIVGGLVLWLVGR